MITSSERQEMDTSMRCLQLALHPNTGVGERMAGIDGYLRKAKGRPVIGMCIELYGKGDKIRLKEQNQQLLDIERENLRLREMWQQETERADRAEAQLRMIEPKRQVETEMRIKIRWSDEEFEFLAVTYMADPSRQNKTVAALCSQQFNREITAYAVGGQIDRLRKSGRLPKYRPGYEREIETEMAAD